jgi:hypothetical protein
MVAQKLRFDALADEILRYGNPGFVFQPIVGHKKHRVAHHSN